MKKTKRECMIEVGTVGTVKGTGGDSGISLHDEKQPQPWESQGTEFQVEASACARERVSTS